MNAHPFPSRRVTRVRPEAVRRGLIGAIAVVIAIQCRSAISASLRHDEVDFGVYRAGGLALLRGADLYALHVGALRLPFTYPPVAAALFAPLTAFGVRTGQAVWAIASLVALWCVVRLGLRRYATEAVGHSTLVTALVFVLVLYSDPSKVGLRLGQINVFILLLILADFCGCFGRVPRGSFIGLAAALKLTPAYLIVYMLAVRRSRAAAVAASTFAAVSFAALAAGPSTSWHYWFGGYVTNAKRAGNPEYISNQSLNGFFVRLTGGPGHARLLWLSSALVTTVVVLWAARRAHAERPWLAEGLAMAGIVLVSPLSWVHHWILVLPLLIASFRHAAEVPQRLRIALVTATLALSAVLLSGVVWRVPSGGEQVYRATVWQFLVGNSQVLLLLVVVLLLAVSLAGDRNAGLESGDETAATPPGSAELHLDGFHDRA